jgi:hypothetical protein
MDLEKGRFRLLGPEALAAAWASCLTRLVLGIGKERRVSRDRPDKKGVPWFLVLQAVIAPAVIGFALSRLLAKWIGSTPINLMVSYAVGWLVCIGIFLLVQRGKRGIDESWY